VQEGVKRGTREEQIVKMKPFLLVHFTSADVATLVAQYAVSVFWVGQEVALCRVESGDRVWCAWREALHKTLWPAKIIKQNTDPHLTLVVWFDDGDKDNAMHSECAYVAVGTTEAWRREPIDGQWDQKGVVVAVNDESGLAKDGLCLPTDTVSVSTKGEVIKVSKQCARFAPWGAEDQARSLYRARCLKASARQP